MHVYRWQRSHQLWYCLTSTQMITRVKYPVISFPCKKIGSDSPDPNHDSRSKGVGKNRVPLVSAQSMLHVTRMWSPSQGLPNHRVFPRTRTPTPPKALHVLTVVGPKRRGVLGPDVRGSWPDWDTSGRKDDSAPSWLAGKIKNWVTAGVTMVSCAGHDSRPRAPGDVHVRPCGARERS